MKGWAWAYTYSVLPNFACEARPAQGLDIVVDRDPCWKLDIQVFYIRSMECPLGIDDQRES